MNDETQIAETAAPAPAAEKVAPAPKDTKNGVTRPKLGTKTGRVWEIADYLSAQAQRPALREEVLASGEAEGLTKGTIATQYARWTRYYDVTKDARKSARDAMKPPTPAEEAPVTETAAE